MSYFTLKGILIAEMKNVIWCYGVCASSDIRHSRINFISQHNLTLLQMSSNQTNITEEHVMYVHHRYVITRYVQERITSSDDDGDDGMEKINF